ncbi:uncharacterized protein FFC1_15903 [Fusarium fujikuroi]|nr:uncharacterized protein FFC1_15903 [Fusarium fujikuroi]
MFLAFTSLLLLEVKLFSAYYYLIKVLLLIYSYYLGGSFIAILGKVTANS